MVAMETTTVMKILISILVNIFKLLKDAKFDYDQIKEENVVRNWNFQLFCFFTNLNQETFMNFVAVAIASVPVLGHPFNKRVVFWLV